MRLPLELSQPQQPVPGKENAGPRVTVAPAESIPMAHISPILRKRKAGSPYLPKNPHRIIPYSICDGRLTTGFVEVRDNYFVAFDVDGQLIGKFRNLQAACRALPGKSA
jgi:hypothetical protein